MDAEAATQPCPEDDGKALLQRYMEDKKRSTLYLIQLGKFSCVMGVILFLALTIDVSLSRWGESNSSIIAAYFFCFSMIGFGAITIRIHSSSKIGFGVPKMRGLLHQNNFKTGSLHWNTEAEVVRSVTLSLKDWMIPFGLGLILTGIISGGSEIAMIVLDISPSGWRFANGLHTGISVVFGFTGLTTLVAVCKPTRKTVFLTILMSFISFIGCIALTVYSDGFFMWLTSGYFFGWSSRNKEILMEYTRLGVSKSPEGKFLLPYVWPHLVLVFLRVATPAVAVVISLALFVVGMTGIFEWRRNGENDLRKPDDERAFGYKGLGLALAIFSIVIYASILAQSNISTFDSYKAYYFSVQAAVCLYVLAAAGIATYSFKQRKSSLAHGLTVFILSLVALSVCIYMIEEQSVILQQEKRNFMRFISRFETNCDANSSTSEMLSKSRNEFCFWANSNAPSAVTTTTEAPRYSGYNQNYPTEDVRVPRFPVCISHDKVCDGVIDLFLDEKNPNFTLNFFTCEKVLPMTTFDYRRNANIITDSDSLITTFPLDEKNCSTTNAWIGFYIFNILVGSIGIIISAGLAVSTIGSVGILFNRILRFFYWFHDPLRSESDEDEQFDNVILQNQISE